MVQPCPSEGYRTVSPSTRNVVSWFRRERQLEGIAKAKARGGGNRQASTGRAQLALEPENSTAPCLKALRLETPPLARVDEVTE